jgi:hypothetical protein
MNRPHVLRIIHRAMCSMAMGLLLSMAHADNLRVANAPAAWRNECAGCHLAYPPSLLSANQWKVVMQGLKRHYGTDASLSEVEVAEITTFLAAHAGQHSARTPMGSELPRVTHTAWFERKHRKVPAAAWNHPQIKQRNNCAACHTRAQEGLFSEHDVSVPGMKGYPW